MRGKPTLTIRRGLLALAVGGLLAAVTAGAGDLMGLNIAKRSKGTRLTDAPRLTFTTGVLRQGRLGTWQFEDGTPLRLMPDLVWREEGTGQVGYPTSGRQVMVAGQRVGGVLTVRQAMLLSPERQVQVLQLMHEAEPDQPEPDLPK